MQLRSAPTAFIVPGRCRGDLEALSAHYGVPVQRGPEELKDLPRFFDRDRKPVDLSDYDIAIFAEIVDAPRLTSSAIVERARALRARRRRRDRSGLSARHAVSRTSRTACQR